jgi:hypothetical protein
MADRHPEPFPHLDLETLLGLTVPEATTMAKAAGVERIRPIELMDGAMAGAIDLAIGWERLNL